MNTYLQNVVRRGAGLPLALTAAPRPSHGFERSVGTTAALQEIATEQTAQHRTEDSSNFQVAATSEFSRIVNPAIQPRPQEQQLPTSPSLVTPDDKPPSSARDTFTLASEHEPPRTNAKSFVSQAIETVTKVRAVESTQIGSEPPSNQKPTSQANERPKVFAKAVGKPVPRSGEISIAVQSIRPADAERPNALQFPKVAAGPQLPPEPVPIHVRVGRVEVRGGPSQPPTRSTPAAQAPLGFVRYHRMRRYRN